MTRSRQERRLQRGQVSADQPSQPAVARSPFRTLAIILVGGAAIGGAVAIERTRTEPEKPAPIVAIPTSAPSVSPAAQTFVPQPAGEAPAGKVWSPTCGHWHDAVTGQPAN